MIRTGLATVCLLTFATATLAETMPTTALTYLDVNADSAVSLDEFSGQMMQFFDPMDTNSNGRLEFGEVEGFMSRETFDGTDANGNGTVSKVEYKAQVERDFMTADENADGVLD